MDKLVKLPRETQAVLGGSVLYLIFSFFDWQQAVRFIGTRASGMASASLPASSSSRCSRGRRCGSWA